MRCVCRVLMIAVLAIGFSSQVCGGEEKLSVEDIAGKLVEQADVSGGVIVHLGCGDGRLSAALGEQEAFLVHGLDASPASVEGARAHVIEKDRYGRVSVDRLMSLSLPYADNMVNVVVADERGRVTTDEIMRVLAPGGVVFLRDGESWKKVSKPWPEEVDEWTHFLHGPDGNAVADDERVGPPRHMQWVGDPRWARAHEQMASISSVVTSGGRIFYIVDEAPTASIAFPGQWSLVARDAFNGVMLWKRPIAEWEDHRRDFRSGPSQLSRRLVAVNDLVYVTLGFRAPVSVLDAKTGETVRELAETGSAQEILVGDGCLVVAIGDPAGDVAAEAAARRGERVPETEKRIVAYSPDGSTRLWEKRGPDAEQLMPMSLALGEGKVFFQNFTELACLDAKSGSERWRSERRSSLDRPAWSAPTVVVHDGVVLSADRAEPKEQGGELPEQVKWTVSLNGGGETGELVAFSAETGERLWSCPAGECFNGPVDLFVADGLVWVGETARRGKTDFTVARNLETGEVEREIETAEAFTNCGMPHHRCYRNKATNRFILMGRVGVEMIDLAEGGALRNHWVRGTCQYGIMPANGLLYAPSHSCACYIKGKLNGFNALAASRVRRDRPFRRRDVRFEKGPAYGAVSEEVAMGEGAWPTYRGDMARSGAVPADVGNRVTPGWTIGIGGRLTSLTSDGARVLVAAIDAHTVHCLNADDGTTLWTYTAGGRVDSPPTIHAGTALFGSADGWIYCVRMEDGALAWRYRAAPEDRRIVAYGQLESVWPVSGSVLVKEGIVFAAAGRSSFLDGGILLVRLDARTGERLSETVISDLDESGRQPDDTVKGFEMDGALPDVLSSDGDSVFMRHLRFDREGRLLKDPVAHLFTPTGFLDDSWWHRSYWVFSDVFNAGWGGWWKIGNRVPSGRILSVRGDTVYGFGRDQYLGGNTGQWRGGERNHLFAMDRSAQPDVPPVQKRRGKKQPKPPAQVFRWSKELPIWAKGMVLAGDTLVVAGPPEPKPNSDNPLALEDVEEAKASLAGKRGGMLRTVSSENGQAGVEIPLNAPPVFDGLITAGGKLFLSDTDGNVTCFYGASP